MKRQGRTTWSSDYRRLLQPTFVDVRGRVFVLGTRSRRTIREFARQFDEIPGVVDENTMNHEHFWYFDNSTIEGCRNDWVLAEATRLTWQEQLRYEFLDRSFELFVCNEYMIIEELDSPGTIAHEEVTPTLRLWSRGDAQAEDLRASYRVDELGPDKVFWADRIEDGLFDLEEIFELIAAGPDHPAKRDTLRGRRGPL